jgi:hypothetical protein
LKLFFELFHSQLDRELPRGLGYSTEITNQQKFKATILVAMAQSRGGGLAKGRIEIHQRVGFYLELPNWLASDHYGGATRHNDASVAGVITDTSGWFETNHDITGTFDNRVCWTNRPA